MVNETFLNILFKLRINLHFKLSIVLICLPFLSFTQSLDIHSSKIEKEEQIILRYYDSLSNVDYQQSSDFALFVLKEISSSQKPRFYNTLLSRAIFSAYHTGNLELTDSLNQRLQTMPQNTIHPLVKADLLYHQAMALRMYKRYMEAINLVKEAFLIYHSSKDVEGQIKLQILLMTLYNDIQNYNLAYEYYTSNLLFLDRKINQEFKLKLIKDGARFLVLNHKYDEAADQLEMAWELVQKLDDVTAKARILSLKGLFYYQQKNYSKSEAYFNQSLELAQKLNNKMFMARLLTFKAATAMRTKEYAASLNYNRLAYNLRNNANSEYLSASSLVNIANCMIQLQEYDSAHLYLDKGEERLLEYGTKIDLVRIQDVRQNLFIQQNDFENAFYALEQGVVLQDSLFHIDNQRKINELETIYESGKFEQQKKEIEAETDRQNQLNARNKLLLRIVLIVMALAMFASFLLYQYSISKNKRRLLDVNQKMVMIQMNSHFVFNALTAIQSLIYKNQIEAAIYYLSLFSSLINRILSISSKSNISLQSELSFVKEFLLIQKLRFGDDLKYKLEVAKDLDLTKIQLPPLLTYPFLEYAAEECVQQSKKDTMILIKVRKENKYLYYEIIDIGLGFSDLEKSYIKRYGGQKILCKHFIKERISLNNHFLKTKIIFAKNNIEYEGMNYSILQFKIKV